MPLQIAGYHDSPDFPKMGPSLLIAASLIFAIRTAKRPPDFDPKFAETELQQELDYAAHVARRMLGHLISRYPVLFPSQKVPWYQPDEDESPK